MLVAQVVWVAVWIIKIIGFRCKKYPVSLWKRDILFSLTQRFQTKQRQLEKRSMKAILFLLTLLLFNSVNGQNKKGLEISVVGRYDRHAHYISNFAGRAYNDTNKLYGFSYGANLAYRQQVSKTFSIYIGFGYYRLKIDKIKGSMPFNIPGVRTGRNIDYTDSLGDLLYSTTKYHYNNLAFTLGLNKTILIKHQLFLDFGVEGIGYYTISQRYKLVRNYNNTKYYFTNNKKPLEFGVDGTLGVLKEYNKFYIRPAFIIPICQSLKGDKVFYEDKNMNIPKWFHGIGITLKVGKYF